MRLCLFSCYSLLQLMKNNIFIVCNQIHTNQLLLWAAETSFLCVIFIQRVDFTGDFSLRGKCNATEKTQVAAELQLFKAEQSKLSVLSPVYDGSEKLTCAANHCSVCRAARNAWKNSASTSNL